jgi:hypothetical protein
MTNDANCWVLFPEIERAVAHLLDWPMLKPKTIEPANLSTDQFNEYTGIYKMGGFEVEVTRDSSLLNFAGGGLEWTLVPTSSDTL